MEDQRPILSISFPIQYELIWGMNKKEAEGQFQDGLKAFLSKERNLPVEALPTEMSLIRDNCYRSEGDFMVWKILRPIDIIQKERIIPIH